MNIEFAAPTQVLEFGQRPLARSTDEASHPDVDGQRPPDPQPDRLWHLRAACRGPHQQIFYPPTRFERRVEKRRREARAKEICASCSVLEACRQQAIERREPYGIWGGLTEQERREVAAVIA